MSMLSDPVIIIHNMQMRSIPANTTAGIFSKDPTQENTPQRQDFHETEHRSMFARSETHRGTHHDRERPANIDSTACPANPKEVYWYFRSWRRFLPGNWCFFTDDLGRKGCHSNQLEILNRTHSLRSTAQPVQRIAADFTRIGR